MRPYKSASVMLLASLLTGCSASGNVPEGTAAQICKGWPLITPSKSKDRISEPTARQIGDANIANEQWCKSTPQKVATAG